LTSLEWEDLTDSDRAHLERWIKYDEHVPNSIWEEVVTDAKAQLVWPRKSFGSPSERFAMSFPLDPDALLLRKQTAEALTSAGYPTASATLATMATRGGGPPYRLFGRRAVYRLGDALDWAQSRLNAPRRSTSEADAAAADPSSSRTGHRNPPR
jgi:hypothetical protein